MVQQPSSPRIEIFTDGAALGNPGPGGYGVILRSLDTGRTKEISEGYRLTTNNRMELLAVIVALEALKIENSIVTIYSDSRYVVDAVEKGWVFNWVKKNFKGKKNRDLWERFLRVYPKHRVKFFWVKGHAGHPENERADALSVAAANGKNLSVDDGYETLANFAE